MSLDRKIEPLSRSVATARLRGAARNSRSAMAQIEDLSGSNDAESQKRHGRHLRRLRKLQGVARRAGIDVNGPAP